MQKKRGISLIVLVITIIVMIILAAAIILSLNNAGIIGNANKAVDETNIANIKSAADLAYAEYLITGIGDKTEEELGTEITQKLIDNNTIKGNDYYIKVFDGETYVIKEGSLVDKYYDNELIIGDYIDYDALNHSITINQYIGEYTLNNMSAEEVKINSNSEMKWKFLGVEGDKVKIISEEVVNPVNMAGEELNGFSLYGAYGWLKGIEILDNACSVFGHGKHAYKARSINEDDINSITNFNKYNTSIDIYHNASNIPYYKDVVYGTEVVYDGKTVFKPYGNILITFPILKQPDINTEGYLKDKPLTVVQNNYSYVGSTQMGTTESEGYKILFRNLSNTDNSSYWLASMDNTTHIQFISYGLKIICRGELNRKVLYVAGSDGNEDFDYGVIENAEDIGNYPIRPVVLLDGNVISEKVDSVWRLK